MTVSVWVLGDQLLKTHPVIAAAEADHGKDNIHIVMVEGRRRAQKLSYHRKKLVLLFSAMRHYAHDLRECGYTVDYVHAETLPAGIADHIQRTAPDKIYTMEAADYTGRQFQRERLQAYCDVVLVGNAQFLIAQYNPYADHPPEKRAVMEYFYREMRRRFNILMDDADTPTGGAWNYDKENRKSLPPKIDLPPLPSFEPDAITQSVMADVVGWGGIGQCDDFDLAVTHEQAQVALDDFIAVRLENFGAYEDAMTTRNGTLFHAVLSPYVNIGLLEPMQMIEAAVNAYAQGLAPINSVEGFVRQVLGWREYMYWHYWRQMPQLADANYWSAERNIPTMLWDGDTKMNCIHHVVDRLQQTGYSHHIERLMLLSNFALLAGINPRKMTDWFKSFYIDAYDWVMQPNAIGMGLNADGGTIATKPYIASANYINKMSDYCKGCHFHHKKRTGEDACPFNYLYWNFLITHEDALRSNPRSGRNVLGLRHLDDEERQQVQKQAQAFLEDLTYDDD
jgi:deoxyribodipyrimidine photolyase-related protein